MIYYLTNTAKAAFPNLIQLGVLETDRLALVGARRAVPAWNNNANIVTPIKIKMIYVDLNT